MASYGHRPAAAAARPGQQAAHGALASVPGVGAPVGTFAPGTKIQVGSHRVVIQKYLSEGGFAHVYLVKLPRAVDGTDLAVLKRVAVPDKDTLRGMRTEVETMKRLKGHKPIVTYMDSHASELRGGGYEVFLLMEYCNGGGLIDFMNTRLQHRLTEPEILKIFTDVAEGVACMHYLKPPLLHRDLKVENVLILASGSSKRFKVCDFGSAASPKPAPTTVVECRQMDEDIQKHTTLQYRSPEMIDVYRKQPIDEKSDIWALGVLLYKLCYYTTPFEDQGQLAILNASYRFPPYPVFSDKLRKLIASMLKEAPQARPTIYQVLRDGCLMQGREVPIQDIYSARSHSEPRTKDRVPSTDSKPQSTPVVGAVFSPQAPQQQAIPEIVPMRRGRPPAAIQPTLKQTQPSKPNPAPSGGAGGDPFAALDAKSAKGPGDELSSRFPTLDQFSLLHDKGAKFDFDAPSPPSSQPQPGKDISQRITDKLADDAFAGPKETLPATTDPSRVKPAASTVLLSQPPVVSAPLAAAVPTTASIVLKSAQPSKAQSIIASNPELQAIASQPSQPHKQPSKPVMVSTGTMTVSPPPDNPPANAVPIYRFPSADQGRSSSVPRQSENARGVNLSAPDEKRPIANSTPPSLYPHAHTRHPSSSRPSLEGGRPPADHLDSHALGKSAGNRPRPASTHLVSNIDFLRERELAAAAPPNALRLPQKPEDAPTPPSDAEEDVNIESNVEFLRSMEDSDSRKRDRGSKHGKRSSLTSLSGTKNIIAGKFGDAFKRFENNNTASHPLPPRTPSPLKELDRRLLTPIAGSEATDGRSDDGQVLDEMEGLSPEMRREVERRRLLEEERRVEAAQAEYRQRLAQKGESSSSGTAPLPKSIGGVSRAVSIQNRVQNLLSEDQRTTSQVQRTAEGYGRFADAATTASRVEKELPHIPRKPVGAGKSKPAAPRKPVHLNSLPSGGKSGSPPKYSLPSRVPTSTVGQSVDAGRSGGLTVDMTAAEKEDYLRDFTKRFPSLSVIEMVERDLSADPDRDVSNR